MCVQIGDVVSKTQQSAIKKKIPVKTIKTTWRSQRVWIWRPKSNMCLDFTAKVRQH